METEKVVVTIPQGILQGQKETSVFGDEYYSFQKIPYAKPPIGELRFKAPQPAEGWFGIRDATKPGAICPSENPFTSEYLPICSEDSLFINVYSKQLKKKLPVLVWIHGGGWTLGSGNKDSFGPDYFMSHDVVVVTLNYRLGALGFLSLKTPECPGNFGLKDQRLALIWVKNNISYFGGNPDNVTIFGESAGGVAVHLLMLSPTTKGLFHKAISQSGSALSRTANALFPRESAYILGKRLGCNAKSDSELLDFLRKASPKDIVEKSKGIIHEVEGRRPGDWILSFSFTPGVEPESEDAIITKSAIELLSEKNESDVPYITGSCTKEMILGISSITDVPKWTDDADYQGLIPKILNVVKDSELSIKIAKRIKEFYFKNGIDVNSYIDVLSDVYFVHGIYFSAKYRVKKGSIKSPTYLYQFSFDGCLPIIKKMFGLTDIKGTCHGDDVNYLFLSTLYNQSVEPNSPEHKTILRLVKMWVNFAKTGAPTNEDFEIKWPRLEAGKDAYLDINEELTISEGFFKERMEFWNEMWKLAGKI